MVILPFQCKVRGTAPFSRKVSKSIAKLTRSGQVFAVVNAIAEISVLPVHLMTKQLNMASKEVKLHQENLDICQYSKITINSNKIVQL